MHKARRQRFCTLALKRAPRECVPFYAGFVTALSVQSFEKCHLSVYCTRLMCSHSLLSSSNQTTGGLGYESLWWLCIVSVDCDTTDSKSVTSTTTHRPLSHATLDECADRNFGLVYEFSAFPHRCGRRSRGVEHVSLSV